MLSVSRLKLSHAPGTRIILNTRDERSSTSQNVLRELSVVHPTHGHPWSVISADEWIAMSPGDAAMMATALRKAADLAHGLDGLRIKRPGIYEVRERPLPCFYVGEHVRVQMPGHEGGEEVGGLVSAARYIGSLGRWRYEIDEDAAHPRVVAALAEQMELVDLAASYDVGDLLGVERSVVA